MDPLVDVVRAEFNPPKDVPFEYPNPVPSHRLVPASRVLLLGLAAIVYLGYAPQSKGSESTAQPKRILGQGILRSYAISPSRRLIASVGSGGTFLWSLTTGELLQTFPHGKDLLYDVAFTANSESIISVGTPRTTIWSVDSSVPPKTLPGGNGSAVAFSHDREILLVRKLDLATAWSPATTTQLASFHHPEIRAMDIDSSGTLVLTCGADRQAVLWDLQTQERIHTLPHPEPLFEARFSPDASKMIFGARAQIWIWDTATGQLIDHLTETRSGDLGTDNIRLATKGADRNAHLWLTDPPTKLFSLAGNPNPLEEVQFSPDDTWIVGEGRENTWLWNPETGELAEQVSAYQPRFSPDGSLFVARQKEGDFELWESFPTGKIRSYRGHTSGQTAATHSPNGQFIGLLAGSSVLLFSHGSGKTLTIPAHDEPISSIAFSPDGGQLVSTSEDARVKIWSTPTGQLLHSRTLSSPALAATFLPASGRLLVISEEEPPSIWNAELSEPGHLLEPHGSNLAAFQLDASSAHLATADESGRVVVSQLESAQVTTSFELSEEVTALAFTPNSETIFVGTREGPSYLFEVESGQRLQSIETGPAWDARISPDGSTVLIAGAKSWDLSTGQQQHEFKIDDRQGANADGIAFSPDGRFIAGTGSVFDASAKVWHAATGQLICTFDRHEGTATSIEFSPDSQSLLTTASDGRAMVWEIPNFPLIHVAREDNSIKVTWDLGTLERSPFPTGPWLRAPLQISPSHFPATESQEFFRVVPE